MIDKVVESKRQQMDMDVSTITDFPEDDDLLMLEDAKEDEFQYEDNPVQANMMIPRYLMIRRAFLTRKSPSLTRYQ